jgi:hypothetical protein
MADVEMREFIQILNENSRVDEFKKGGLLDKVKAAFGNAGAEGRVEVGKERAQLEKGWKKYAGAKDLDINDEAGFMEFLKYWNFTDEEASLIRGEGQFDLDKSLNNAAKIQWASGNGITGPERGGPFQDYDPYSAVGKKKDSEKEPEEYKTPKGTDFNSIVSFYSNELGGEVLALSNEIKKYKKNPKALKNHPLAVLGIAYMRAAGRI